MTKSGGNDMQETIRDLQDEFDKAELNADIETLGRLLADDFVSIGPKGFVLDKQQWIDRHVHFKYHKLETSDMNIRIYDRTAIVHNIQRNRATFNDQHVELAVRVTQVWLYQRNRWQLAAIQFSPLSET
jgi:hypothetical protein